MENYSLIRGNSEPKSHSPPVLPSAWPRNRKCAPEQGVIYAYKRPVQQTLGKLVCGMGTGVVSGPFPIPNSCRWVFVATAVTFWNWLPPRTPRGREESSPSHAFPLPMSCGGPSEGCAWWCPGSCRGTRWTEPQCPGNYIGPGGGGDGAHRGGARGNSVSRVKVREAPRE